MSAGGIAASWPTLPDDAAYAGWAGYIARMISPHTEADPLALLVQLLIFFGSVVGRGPHFVAEGARHYTVENTVLVGETSKSRKGSSLARVKEVFTSADPEWLSGRVVGGLSSGEGLIWAVRDPVAVTGGKDDPGVPDKRLLVVEGEFASMLKVMSRQGNTLSPVVRQAWDCPSVLQSLTKNSPAKASNPHISIIGHITRDELRRRLDSTEAGNGFGNRFLWVCARRSKLLPLGGHVPEPTLSELRGYVLERVLFARTVGEMQFDQAALQQWYKVYPSLSEGKPGLLGAVTGRAEAHVRRLSMLYALMDQTNVITDQALKASLALWGYCERSAQYIFGDALGNTTADSILGKLRQSPAGMTRTDIRDHFARNKTTTEIDQALQLLVNNSLVYPTKVDTGGRPGERWFAIPDSHGQP